MRVGVNVKDLFVKGVHLHFDEGLEMGLKTLKDGKVGLEMIGKKTYSLLQQKNAAKKFLNRR